MARFPWQLLKDLVSWRSTGECSMIDRFFGDAFGVLSCPFWRTILRCGVRLLIHTLKVAWLYCKWTPCFKWGVFECDILHRRSMAVLWMLYMTRWNPVCLYVVFYLCCMCQCGLYTVHRSHFGTPIRMCLLDTEPHSSAKLLFSSKYLCGTILLTPVFDDVTLACFKSRANAFLLT